MGRNSNWKSGETTAIRIPKALEAQVMAYARSLDDAAVPGVFRVGDRVSHKTIPVPGTVQGRERDGKVPVLFDGMEMVNPVPANTLSLISDAVVTDGDRHLEPGEHPVIPHQVMSPINPLEVKFQINRKRMKGNIVGVLVDWGTQGVKAVLVNYGRDGQVQLPIEQVEFTIPILYKKTPSQYTKFLETVANSLGELEDFVRNPNLPFHVGDKVVIQLSFPDDYRIVEVLEITPVRVGLVEFICLHPDTGDRIRWFWHPGSDTVPLREGETLESAIRRSIAQKSLENLIKTDFRKEAFGLGSLKGKEVA